ncbi:hypothetical protein HS088_TW17G00148 [Tripterygium wilfordii]|uniref:At2g29880-like C-terminal domain-containing protein n=1 Tax=Tripterygium wilfordii TaxID=458696 RepID=A0A7J7CEQ7_TRIWF|nr:hypothetical protein HS088_TW17G00148 [Tripterygium wilfordii]
MSDNPNRVETITVQLHPDARSFRIKTIPYYNDLCLIYGKKTAEGKVSGDTEPQMSEDLVENKITTVVQPQIVRFFVTPRIRVFEPRSTSFLVMPTTSAETTHTDVRQFMTRPVPYYKDLCLICGDSNVGENDGFSIQNLELQNGLQFEILCEESMSHESLAATSSSEDEADNEPGPAYGDLKADIPNRKTKSKPDKCSPSPKKLRAEDWGWHTALREMTNAVYSLADEKKIDENSKSASIETAIKAVQALPDMDEDLILDACDLLEDETKARTFLALEVKLRKKWLSRKLRPLS